MVGLDERVSAALAGVYDPCSIAAGRPTSLVDMGLVLDVTMEGTTLHITFCVTFAGCTMAPHFVEAARTELLKIEGVDQVETRVDTAHVWEPMGRVELRGVPKAWRDRSTGLADRVFAGREPPVRAKPA